MSKNVLALCRQAPYGNALAREGLEAVLAAAAMDQAPAVLFCGDGVFQLLPQSPTGIGEKSLQRNIQALPMFGVEQLYVCSASLTQRGIAPATLAVAGAEIQVVEDTAALIHEFDHVLSF